MGRNRLGPESLEAESLAPQRADGSAPSGAAERYAATPGRWLAIVGIGEDGTAALSPAARTAITGAAHVFGGARHLALAAGLVTGTSHPWPSPLAQALDDIAALAGTPVCVLASGDPFHYGVGAMIVARFGADAICSFPQPSAFALGANRLGWSLPDVALTTAHGRALEGIVPHLHPGARLMVLSWDERTPREAASLLVDRGFGNSRLVVLEALGGPAERVRSVRADTFDVGDIAPLNMIAIEVVAGPRAFIIPLTPGLPDDAFESDGQLTKREIRSMTLSALAPRRGERLWDIGTGSGSIAIEWLLADPSLGAIGIEENAERAGRALRNASKLGVPRLQIVQAGAPAALAGLPTPDVVFIGGGLGDPGVFETAWAALPSGGRLVANAVSIESEAILARLFAAHGGDMCRLRIERLEGVGAMHGWRPAMPVTQWRVVKP